MKLLTRKVLSLSLLHPFILVPSLKVVLYVSGVIKRHFPDVEGKASRSTVP